MVFKNSSTTAGSIIALLKGMLKNLIPAAFAAAVSASISAPCSVGCRRLMMDANPIFLISVTADGGTGPAHDNGDSTPGNVVVPATDSFVALGCSAAPRSTPVALCAIA